MGTGNDGPGSSGPGNPQSGKDEQAPNGIDTTVPHSARVWNYWLGGKDNYAVDRALGDQIGEVMPGIDRAALVSREFLRRAVRHLVAEASIRQFLDIGTGLPTANNTHDVAQSVAPECRVVYVDNDPLVLAHARALLTGTREGMTGYLDADLHRPADILAKATSLLDFSQPIGLILGGILGHIGQQDKALEILGKLLSALPTGSYFVWYDGVLVDTSETILAAAKNYNESGTLPYHLRTPEQFNAFFAGLEVIEPGIVPCVQWRPTTLEKSEPIEMQYGAVAVKRQG